MVESQVIHTYVTLGSLPVQTLRTHSTVGASRGATLAFRFRAHGSDHDELQFVEYYYLRRLSTDIETTERDHPIQMDGFDLE
jgi:hypothetical protein